MNGQPRFHPKFLDFASYYGFVPRVCHPYRPETKGKIESGIRFVKSDFWPPAEWIALKPAAYDAVADAALLADFNRQALAWYERVSGVCIRPRAPCRVSAGPRSICSPLPGDRTMTPAK